MDSVKILHVFDCAAVACTMAKEQRKMGHDASVMSYSMNDPFYTLDYYGEDRPNFRTDALWGEAVYHRAVEYDVIHVHFQYHMVPLLKQQYPKKTIVLHYHGGDVRRASDQAVRRKCQEYADYVIAGHPEVYERVKDECKVYYVPTIIETELIHPIEHGKGKFIMHWSVLDWDLIREHMATMGITEDTKIIKREDKPRANYTMPELYCDFGTYVNIIYSSRQLIESLSKTALECLACGLNVLKWDGTYLTELPEEHRPENVMKALPYMQ